MSSSSNETIVLKERFVEVDIEFLYSKSHHPIEIYKLKHARIWDQTVFQCSYKSYKKLIHVMTEEQRIRYEDDDHEIFQIYISPKHINLCIIKDDLETTDDDLFMPKWLQLTINEITEEKVEPKKEELLEKIKQLQHTVYELNQVIEKLELEKKELTNTIGEKELEIHDLILEREHLRNLLV